MRRVLPAWLTAMPGTLRSGDVCQIATQMRSEAFSLRLVTGARYDAPQVQGWSADGFCPPRSGVTNGGPPARDRSASFDRERRASLPR